jgi:hypothetical protein
MTISVNTSISGGSSSGVDLSTQLSGLDTSGSTAVTATDTIIGGFGKLQGQINTVSGYGSISMTFSTTTTDADPGAGVVRFNNATQSSATILYVDATDANGIDLTPYYKGLGEGVVLTFKQTSTKWQTFLVQGIALATGYWKITVVWQMGGTALDNAASLSVSSSPGAPYLGTLTGDVTAVTRNADGTVATVTINSVVWTQTYNTNGTLATETSGGLTRTYNYSAAGVFTGTSGAVERQGVSWGTRGYLTWYENDFFGNGAANLAPFTATAIASGTLNAPTAGVATADHPGNERATSSTTTNSGVAFHTGDAANLRLGGGEVFVVIFRAETFTNTTLRTGFHDTLTATAPVDGVYFEYSGSGALVGKTRSNSVESVTATLTTLSTATFYRLEVRLDETLGNANFSVYSEAGSLLASATLSTNIPTASGRECQPCFNVTNSGTSAVDLAHVDYMGFGTLRRLVR